MVLHSSRATRAAWRCAALVGLFAMVTGCRKTPDHDVDGWAVARAALLDGTSCYEREPAYCIDDPAVVDAAIQEAIARRAGGTMPSASRKVDDVVRTARTQYREHSRSEAGLRAIEAKVAAVYASPKVDLASDPSTVAVDLGVVPGPLVVRARSQNIERASSPSMNGGNWSEREAARVLHEYARRHPDRDVVRASIVEPGGRRVVLVYRYLRKQGRIVFGEEGSDQVRVLSLAPGAPELASGAFRWADARSCSSADPELPTDCPTADPVLTARRQASRRSGSR